MTRLFTHPKIFALAASLLLSYVAGWAQPTGLPSSIPAGGLPQNLQQRVQELNRAGITPQQIEAYRQSGQIPAGMSTIGASSATLPTTAPAAAQITPTEIQGKDDVLEEEKGEYEDRPQEKIPTNLQPVFSKVFGHDIFNDTTLDFNVFASRSVPEDYLIGTGDQFQVTISGTNNYSENLTVREDGSVQVAVYGKVFVGGMTFMQAREALRSRYRSIVSSQAVINVQLSPNARAITVNIVGEVRKPGAYRISPATPAFNALFFAGGVSDIGTVRNIQIRRNGRLVQVLDLYDYLIRGTNTPIFLQENDFIYVPIQGKIAEAYGGVRRAKEYELREGEHLKTLIEFSGGLTYDALRLKAQLARLENQTTFREVLIDIALDSILRDPAKDYFLQDGDQLYVEQARRGAFNIVQIFGDVEYPGTYQLVEGGTVLDLITRAGGVSINSYLDRAYVVRIVPGSNDLQYIPVKLTDIFTNPSDSNNIPLQFFDALRIFSQSEFKEKRYISLTGQVRRPGIYQTSEGMTLKDLIFMAGGFKDEADLRNIELSTITRAEFLDLARFLEESQKAAAQAGTPIDPVTGNNQGGAALAATDTDPLAGVTPDEQVVQRISVDAQWQNDPLMDTLTINQYDRVRIYSKYDFIFSESIAIEGAVKRPGEYLLKRGMTLKDLLYQAGGLTENADVKEVELYRDIDLDDLGNFNTGTSEKEIIRVKIDEDWQTGTITDSLIVEDYRKIIIRSETDFFTTGYVTIKGYVNQPGTFEVSPNMTLKDLIYKANGLRMEADFDKIELTRIIEVEGANGTIIPTPISISEVSASQNWQSDSNLDQIKLNHYDQVFVRRNPFFELQQSVFVEGEVLVEGEYNKSSKTEHLSSLVARAGGITDLAYLDGAYLLRPEIGQVSLRLEKALKRPGTRFDIPLQKGDTLVIPARLDIVTINGNVRQPSTTVIYEIGNKKLKYYVQFAGGFDKRTRKKDVTVAYMDGRVKGSHRILFKRIYPKVEQGSVINVPAKPTREEQNRPATAGFKVSVQDILASLTSVLTFYLLINTTINR